MKRSDFVDRFRDVFEHSPWVPQRAWEALDQQSQKDQGEWERYRLNDFHRVMVKTVKQASPQEKLSLLRAHPQLAGREAQEGNLSSNSHQEQAGAQLNQLSSEEMKNITSWNNDYLKKFGFPFIIAVRRHDKEGIFKEFRRRLDNDRETEITTALEQVYEIAKIRMNI